MSGKPLCALCLTQPAELYCKNDDANLCTACDVTYHSSNPLANRHERIPLPQCLNESCSSAILPASSLGESDGDLAVVPEYKPSGDLQFGDTMFGANGLAGSSLNSGLNTADLFDMNGGGNGFLDFDLNDLLDFSTPDDDSHTMAQHEHMIKNEDVSIFDAMVPSLDASVTPAANFSSAQAAPPAYNGLSASFMSSQAAFTMPQATMLPYSQETMLHMVPQLQPAPSQNFSPLIPVPSSGGPAPGGAAKLVSTTSAQQHQQHQKQAEFEAAKHQGAIAGGAAPAVPTEVPLTRAERVARYLEKKKRRNFKKVIRYQSRKAYAEVRPRIKGRFATPAEVAAMKAAEAAKLAAAHAPDMDDVAVVPAC